MSNNDPRGSFVRWQTITREQLSYAINLILGLSVAALGFELSLILHVEFGDVLVSDKPALLLSYAFATSSAISVIVQGCSTGLGIWVVLNRLADFRLTASIARRRENSATDLELASDRSHSAALGERTWCLFRFQTFCFGVGMLFAILSVATYAAFKVLVG